MENPCYCGNADPYPNCCEPWHLGFKDHSCTPATAEQLMRSRYSAYVLGLEDYLLASWHASTRPAELNLQQEQDVKWLGLSIRATEAGLAKDDVGYVEFVARYKINGKATRIHERSRFLKENNRWFYVDGEMKA